MLALIIGGVSVRVMNTKQATQFAAIRDFASVRRNSAAAYQIVEGTRMNPGKVLATFAGAYKCGGPATACLKAFDKMKRAGLGQAFFAKVA